MALTGREMRPCWPQKVAVCILFFLTRVVLITANQIEKERKNMARARKEYRELTVSEATNYGMKSAPMLRVQEL